MSDFANPEPVAHLVDARDIESFEVLGPIVEFLTAPRDGEPCVMRGTLPPGVTVPLHAHADPETFLMTSGEIEGLRGTAAGLEWVPIRAGDVFHVPGGARHAFRNPGKVPAVMVIVSTHRIGRFFREIGSPVVPGREPAPPTDAAIRQFLETSERYGYWNAGRQENERVGIRLPTP